MSKRQGLASKLFTVLGGAGLAITIYAPRVNAAPIPPPFTPANYANRYVCNLSAYVDGFDDHATGISKINPNGKGKYTAGTLTSPGTPFFDVDTTKTAPSNFCTYSLNTASSGYSVTSQGIGTDIQSWRLNPGQNALCQASFVMTSMFVLRNNVNANNIVPRLELTIDNFLGVSNPGVIAAGGAVSDVPGTGYCYK
jgi:hypothetical protein